MKKISVLLFGLLAAGQVFAVGTLTCDAAAGAVAVPLVSNMFVVQAFTPRCSTNVNAAYEQNAIAFVVAGSSIKGKNVFVGSTGGGGVMGTACATTPGTCVAGDSTGATAAPLARAT